MFVQFLAGTEHQFVQLFALVTDHQTHRLVLAHRQAVGRKAHGVGHADFNRAFHGFGITGNPPGLLFLFRGCRLLAVGVAVRQHAAGHQGQQCQAQRHGSLVHGGLLVQCW